MTSWTIPEYIEAHPTASSYGIIQIWYSDAVESADKLDPWYAKGYNLLSEYIDTYRDALEDDSQDATMVLALLDHGSRDLNETKEAPPTTEVPPAKTDDPIIQNLNNNDITTTRGLGNNLRTTTFIGGLWVDSDLISLNTSQVSNVDEGNEQSTCTVVLNNNGQKYGKLISTYTWAPRVTGIWSKVYVDINKNGNVTTTSYMLFQGWMSDAKYNHEIATIDFGCFGVIANASYEDDNWSPDDGYLPKMEDVKALIEAGSGKKIDMADLRTKPDLLHKQFFAPSDISGSENLRSIAQDNKESFYYATDWEDNTYIVLIDAGSWTERMFLDPYVLNPGDTSTVYGHANKVTLIAGSTSNDETMKHIPTPLKQEVISVKWNDESIGRYGPIPAYKVSDPNLVSYEKDFESDLMDDNFKQYIDRDIKVDVVNKVPLVLSIVAFTVPDTITNTLTYVFGCVKKKQVEYSSAGLITHLECARINSDLVIDDPSSTNGIIKRITKKDSEENTWEYEWNPTTQQWDLSVVYKDDGITAVPHKYTAPVTPDIIELFDLGTIEKINDSIDPNWRN